MADHAVVVKHIAEVALKIKEAVETVRRNKEDCIQIRRRVVNVSDILSQLQETENIVSSNPAMSAALEDLADTLRRAHTLVIACQEKNMVCLFCTATTLAKKLRRVKDDISDQVMVGIFATTVHVTIALRETPIRGSNHEPEIQRRRRSEELVEVAPCMAPEEEQGTLLPRRRSRLAQAAVTQSPLEEKPESPPAPASGSSAGAVPETAAAANSTTAAAAHNMEYSGNAAPGMATERDDETWSSQHNLGHFNDAANSIAAAAPKFGYSRSAAPGMTTECDDDEPVSPCRRRLPLDQPPPPPQWR